MTTAARRPLALLVGALALALAGAATIAPRTSATTATGRPAVACQPYGATPCLLPFPDNRLTRPDRSTPTGRQLALPAAAMPVSASGVRVSPHAFDRGDGFSPGSAIILHVPGLDNPKAFARTHPVGLLDMARAFAPAAPIVLIDESTGARQLIYSELDANAPTRASTDLMIVPGRELTEGHTYVVVLRDLRTAAGRVISAPAWFARLRDGRPLPGALAAQRVRYARIFAALARAHIGRGNLYEAWDFTVASARSLTSRLLAIRNAAFAQLGDHNLADGKVKGRAPAFTVTATSALAPNLREVDGTFTVPCYLITCGPTATTGFHYSSTAAGALPTQIPGNTASAQFECIVPSSATAAHPARISLYGHGLLGSRGEVTDSWVRALATGYDMVFCATDWWGLADGDYPLAIQAVSNLNHFSALVDRLQQGVLNTLFLGRLMLNRHGLATSPAFEAGGHSILDTHYLYYDGNSQGGIEGGLTTAVSPDIHRSVLGVTGIDYGNMLIQRSTDFAPFKTLLEAAYPDPSLYPVLSDLLQQLWDRGDPDGYAPQMTTHPLPDTPAHEVLMQIAYGDFQVSMYAGAAEARTIGARAVEPALGPARARDRNLFYGIPAVGHYPFAGSAVEIWDSGPGRVQAPPLGNVPPIPAANNNDPHENPRDTPAAQRQISAYLEPHGVVINVCGGSPCHSSVYTP